MKPQAQALLTLVTIMAAALAGCDTGARQVEYQPQRAVSADIAASLDRGPTASQPGITGAQEPLGALPWQIGSHDAVD
jgi:hypothetical protein